LNSKITIEVYMYNTDIPARAELPSSKQLVRSTLIAAAAAILLLITTVLPAEYGIDPIGVGSYLGLTKMGEIKVSLAAEEAAQEAPANNKSVLKQQTAPTLSSVNSAPALMEETAISAKPEKQLSSRPLASDLKSITLQPGEATEIKLVMKKGSLVTYQWKVNVGKVNFDTHGDSPSIDYHGYGKGRQVAGDKGELVAAFDGNHGWYWRNRAEHEVTIFLSTQGDYQSIDRTM
jgi:hypothetical protein